MKKLFFVLFLLLFTVNTFAESYDNVFWDKISEGDFVGAAERGNSVGIQKPHYHLLSSFIYMLLNDSEESENQYILFSERISDYPPQLIEEEFNKYLGEYSNSNIYAYIGAFVFQYRNIFSIDGQKILYDAYKIDERNYIANNYLSMFEYNKGNIERSLEYAMVSIEESDSYSEPYVNAANSLQDLGRKSEAIDILFRALKECKEPHFNAYLSLFYKLGESGSGIVQNFDQTLMAEIIHIEKDSLDIFHEQLKELPNIYYSLIDNLIEKGCYSEADYLLGRIDDVKLESERINYLTVKLFYKAYSQEDFNEAVNSYNNIKHIDPEIVVDIAHMSLMFSSFENAVNLYKEFINMKPDMNSYRLMTSYSNLGTAYANVENYDEAFKFWNLALEIVPDDEITLENIKRYTKEMNE